MFEDITKPLTKQIITEHLFELSKLKYDYDGKKSLPMRTTVHHDCNTWLAHSSRTPDIVKLMPDGTVLMTYPTTNGYDNVNLRGQNTIEILRVRTGLEPVVMIGYIHNHAGIL